VSARSPDFQEGGAIGKPLAWGTLLGGVILFVWGAVYTLAELADIVVGFALAGVALARVVPRA
jgi:hypothetical protein